MENARFDLGDLQDLSKSQRLRGYELKSIEQHPFLAASYTHPEAYFQALHEQFIANGYYSQTVIQERYSLYWDLIEAKIGHRVPAISIYQEDLNWQHFSYDALHKRVGELSAKWAAAGVGNGSSVTLLASVGFEFVTGLLTGLKLGATLSWVAPHGSTFIKNRLSRLDSEFIAANPRHYPELEGQRLDFDRLPAGESLPVPPSVHYEPDSPVLKLLSPLASLRDTPVELTAADLYHRLLNDSLIVLELNGGDRVSLPGMDAAQCQPWALLTTLLAGGTFMHVTPETLTKTPQAWTDYQPTVLGLDDETRKLVVKHQDSIAPSLRLWVRDISEPLDWRAWESFQQGFGERRPWGLNMLVNAAFGGVILFSPRADRVPPIHVTPAPGLNWSLQDQAGPGETRRRATGLYGSPDSGLTEDHHGQILLSQAKPGEIYYIGNPEGVAGARTYPSHEVSTLVSNLPDVSDCTVLQLDRLIDVPGTAVNLLVFLNRALRPHFTVQEKAQLSSTIRALIKQELGEAFVPTEVTLTHAYPERADGALDLSWTQSQFYRGIFEIKEEISIFSTLAALRALVDESKDA